MRTLFIICISLSLLIACSDPAGQDENNTDQNNQKMRALIIDGQSNHGIFPKTTLMMRDYLEETGLFDVDIQRTHYVWLGPHSQMDSLQLLANYNAYPLPTKTSDQLVWEPQPDPNFKPNFNLYDVVISNFGWKASDWPEVTRTTFENYMKNGGGLMVIHSANNSWGDWDDFNRMIGLGGWGERDKTTGPYVYYDEEGKLIRDTSTGQCGSHGPSQEILITVREPEHPIMRGMPTEWLHSKDELYDRMRGPAKGMTVLATAFSDAEGNAPPWDKNTKGSNRHEPMVLSVEYGKGRVVNIALGHSDVSFECVGLTTLIKRGAEWAATGAVTQALPDNFPGAEEVVLAEWSK